MTQISLCLFYVITVGILILDIGRGQVSLKKFGLRPPKSRPNFSYPQALRHETYYFIALFGWVRQITRRIFYVTIAPIVVLHVV